MPSLVPHGDLFFSLNSDSGINLIIITKLECYKAEECVELSCTAFNYFCLNFLYYFLIVQLPNNGRNHTLQHPYILHCEKKSILLKNTIICFVKI